MIRCYNNRGVSNGSRICRIVGIGDLENIHYSRVFNAPMLINLLLYIKIERIDFFPIHSDAMLLFCYDCGDIQLENYIFLLDILYLALSNSYKNVLIKIGFPISSFLYD